MFTEGTFIEVPGSTVRVNATEGAAHITVRTSGLDAGHAYTLWSISFSKWENCTFGDAALGLKCGPGPSGPGSGDDGASDTGFAISQVAGHIVGKSGKANFGGTVPVVDADEAEYHIVVADHGVKVPADLPGQIRGGAPGVQVGFIVP